MTGRILIVDDHELNRDLLSRRLARLGYHVLIATGGQEGIDRASTEHPDLILMDLGMPGIDGWEATRILKGSENTSSIPVVALSAHVMPGDRTRALDAGCDEFGTKPIDFPRLVETIEALIGD
jgi:CheY-like chemotaxis protein